MVMLVGTYWYWVSMEWYWLILDDTWSALGLYALIY